MHDLYSLQGTIKEVKKNHFKGRTKEYFDFDNDAEVV